MSRSSSARVFLVGIAIAAGCGLETRRQRPIPEVGAAGSTASGPHAQGTAGAGGFAGTIGPGGAGGGVIAPMMCGACVCPCSDDSNWHFMPPPPPFHPRFGATVSAQVPPPAISGGTLLMLKDGQTVIAADPDRDRVYVVDLPNRKVTATIALQPGDEPGRVAEGAAGQVHVVLRGGGALATIDPAAGKLLARRPVCAAPRGLAYDAAADLVHVACMEGRLVSLKRSGAVSRTLTFSDDLRDVVVVGARLMVTRFRAAEILIVEADGKVSAPKTLPAFQSTSVRNNAAFTPGVAWRALPTADGALVLHQRGQVDSVSPTVSGYGSSNFGCDGIVHAALSSVRSDGNVSTGGALASAALAVDMALSSDGKTVAAIAAGNATNQQVGSTSILPRVFVADLAEATSPTAAGGGGCRFYGRRPLGDGVTEAGTVDERVPNLSGQPIAVVFGPADEIVVQEREPAALRVKNETIALSAETRADTGHEVFHASSGANIACASCHPEGGEDGRVWAFNGMGPRRTQSLRTPIKGHAPFHWSGDQADFASLLTDVFVGRMSGPKVTPEQSAALESWIDRQPRPARPAPADMAAVTRGAALFRDPMRAGCATCHAGAAFTNDATMDVGTGGGFQVPSLIGVGTRAPFMHIGCAPTLRARFDASCGGANHGGASQLGVAELDDLLTYLATL